MNTHDIERGRRRLKNLLPWARAEVAKRGYETAEKSPLFLAVAPYLTEDNFDALVIYEAPRGGWHADLLLKKVPPGITNVVGTPVQSPCRTKDEAENFAKNILMMACYQSEHGDKTAHMPAFLLYGWEFPLPLMPELAAALTEDAHVTSRLGYGTDFQAAVRVEKAIDELFPNGFDGDLFNQADDKKKAKLIAVLHRAALSGLFRYPRLTDEPSPEPDHPDGSDLT